MTTGYDQFIKACTERCNCCIECSQQVPCYGVMAGGMCDELCYCEEHEEAERLHSEEISEMEDIDFL